MWARPPVVFVSLVTLAFSGLVVNVIQCVLCVCVWPINRRLFYRLVYYPTYWLHSQPVFLAEWLARTDIVCHTQDENLDQYLGKEHAFCILNHRYNFDWMIYFSLCDKFKMLANYKFFAKKSLQYIPTGGWSTKLGGCIFLDRSWEKDKEVIGRKITELLDIPSAMWLTITPEGSRFTREKHAASQKFAREKGLPQLKHHLTPRTKGFTHTIPHLRGNIHVIYDMQMAIKRGAEFTFLGFCLGRRNEVHISIDRIPISTLPEGEEELANWLHDLYQKKDKMAESFASTGDLSDAATPGRRLERRCWSLVNYLTWVAATLTGVGYVLLRLYATPYFAPLVTFILSLYGLVWLTMCLMTEPNSGDDTNKTE